MGIYKSAKKKYFVGIIQYNLDTKKFEPHYIYKIENGDWCLWEPLEVLNERKIERKVFNHDYAIETLEGLKLNGFAPFMQLTII